MSDSVPHQLSWTKNGELSIKDCTGIIKSHNSSSCDITKALDLRAYLYYSAGKYKKSINDYKVLLTMPFLPDRIRFGMLINLGNCYLHRHNFKAAIEVFSEVAECRDRVDPDTLFSALLSRGNAYSRKGRTVRKALIIKAIDDYSAAFLVGGVSSQIKLASLVSRIREYLKLGNLPEALMDLRVLFSYRGEASNQDMADFFILKADYDEKRGKLWHKARDLGRAIPFCIGEPVRLMQILLERADTFDRLECYDEALADLNAIITMPPGPYPSQAFKNAARGRKPDYILKRLFPKPFHFLNIMRSKIGLRR